MKKPISHHTTRRYPRRWPPLLVGMVFGLVIPLGGLPEPGMAATVAGKAAAGEGLTITADRMELDDTQQLALFFGNVRAEEKRILLTADKMTVNYQKGGHRSNTPPTGNRGGGVAAIRAEGHVVLVQGESNGTAEEMIYLVDKQTLEMLGQTHDATIHHGTDQLEGKRILLTIGDDHTISKISVQGGSQRRVSAHITQIEETDGHPNAGHSPPRAPQPEGKTAPKLVNGP